MKFILTLKCESKKNDIYRIKKVIEFDESLYNDYQKKYKPYELKVIEITEPIDFNKFYREGDLLSNYNDKHEKVNEYVLARVMTEEESAEFRKIEELKTLKHENLEENFKNKYLKEEYEKELKKLETELFKCYNVKFNNYRFFIDETLSFVNHIYLLDFDECEVSDVDGNFVILNKNDYKKLYIELLNKKQHVSKIIKENQNKIKNYKNLDDFIDLATKYKHDLICIINNENKRDEEKK